MGSPTWRIIPTVLTKMMVINKAVFCRAPRKQRFRTVPIQIDASKWIWLKIGRPTKSIVSSSGWWFGTFFFQTDDLVGALEHEWIMTFHMLRIIIPTDELIFFRGLGWNHQTDKISRILSMVFFFPILISPATPRGRCITSRQDGCLLRHGFLTCTGVIFPASQDGCN